MDYLAIVERADRTVGRLPNAPVEVEVGDSRHVEGPDSSDSHGRIDPRN